MDMQPGQVDGPETEITEDELFEHWRIVIDPGQQPIRIDRYLMDRVEKFSRNKIQNAIRAGAILVNDLPIKPNHKIKPGQVIQLVLPRPPRDGRVQPENIPLNVVYEDTDLLVVNKPPGLVVHPGIGFHSGTLVNALAYHLGTRDMPVKEGNDLDRPGLVHRIDKNTSGLLVVAKTDYAMTHLAQQFFDHSIDRTYMALVWGSPSEAQGTIDMNIGRHPRQRLLMAAFPDGDEGKEAITHYRVIEDLYYVSVLECKLETGRTHQIRVHLSHSGHPLFNDERYGGDRIVKGTIFSKYRHFVEQLFPTFPRHALHARSLGFTHPSTGERMYFEVDPPEDFKTLLQAWRDYVDGRKKHLN